jgi:hypothetical protein
MAITDEIKRMRQQGRSESEIMQELKNRGMSGRDINQAIEQSRIKEAVSSQENDSEQMQQAPRPGQPMEQMPPQQNSMTQEQYSPEEQEMQPSLMSQDQYPQEQTMQQYPDQYSVDPYSQDPYAMQQYHSYFQGYFGSPNSGAIFTTYIR